MLWTIFVILLVLWLLGMVSSYTMGGFIHVLLVIAIGGMVEIVPLFFQKSTTEAVKGVEPYTATQLVGGDIYIREGC